MSAALDTTDEASPRLLCVDDEPRVLEGLERTLGLRFDVTTATSGAAALELMRAGEPFAAIISDMRMPHMNGATFLALARKQAPDTVRILLTGQADLDAAMAAVNEGSIFRFLTKPCPTERLSGVLDEAVRQYALVRAERELLEKTLTGTITLLTEVLAISYPGAFDRAQRTKVVMRHLCEQLMLDDPWIYEAAAMLAPLGLITVPTEVLERNAATVPLLAKDRAVYQRATAATHRLLANIPRLGVVAEIIRLHAQPAAGRPHTPVEYGAAMLRLAQAAVPLIEQHGLVSALVRLESQLDGWARENVPLLEGLEVAAKAAPRAVMVHELKAGNVLVDDVRGKTGMLLAPTGQVLSQVQIERIRQFAERGGVHEPIRVEGG